MDLLPLFAFIAGLITILSPCIWPILPVVLGISANGGKNKSFGLSIGVAVSFIFLTLLASYTLRIFHIDSSNLQKVFAVLLFLLGMSLIFKQINRIMEYWISLMTSKLGLSLKSGHNTFTGGFLSGIVLGVLWTPCAGPVLATIITLIATVGLTSSVLISALLYGAGIAFPLFLVSFYGSKIILHTKFLNKNLLNIQRAFGVLIMLFGIAIFTGYDKIIQAKLLDLAPMYSAIANKIEYNPSLSPQQTDRPIVTNGEQTSASVKLPGYGKSPEIKGLDNWLNTNKPITMADLKGKVVLIDFWTYSCINCIRTLPHITGWYEKYKDHGFTVIGIHSPEFEFEKNTDNVKDAIARFHINYPVGQDNELNTWKSFRNQYWPAHYLIDAQGNLRDVHFGEGNYAETEAAIQSLLKEAGMKDDFAISSIEDTTPADVQSPETYLGLARMSQYGAAETPEKGIHYFEVASDPLLNYFTYGGTWNVQDEYAESTSDSALEIRYQGKKVFLVINPKNNGDKVKVFLNGNPVDAIDAGADVKDSVITLDKDRLYEIINIHDAPFAARTLRLEFENEGTKVFAFTFGA